MSIRRYNDQDLISSPKYLVAYILLAFDTILAMGSHWPGVVFTTGVLFIWWTTWMVDVIKRGRK